MLHKIYRCLICQALFPCPHLDAESPLPDDVRFSEDAEFEIMSMVQDRGIPHRCDDGNVGRALVAGYIHKLEDE